MLKLFHPLILITRLDTRNAVFSPEPKRMVNLHYTVFIGGIARTIRAYDLAVAFSKFGEVVASTIDLGKLYNLIF
jgi:hypothetical protein